MKQNIKAIIKDYIDYINDEEWELLFRDWYKDVAHKPEHLEHPNWSEILTGDKTINTFFDCLEEAGISNVKKSTLNIRKQIIQEEADKTIERITHNSPHGTIYFQGFKNHMNTFLGLNDGYMRKLFCDICIQRGLKPLTSNSKSAYTW